MGNACDSAKPHNKNSRSHGLAYHLNLRLSISLLGGGPCPAWDIRTLFIYLFIYLFIMRVDTLLLHIIHNMKYIIFYML